MEGERGVRTVAALFEDFSLLPRQPIGAKPTGREL